MQNDLRAFDPDQLRALQEIFDEAWRQITSSSKSVIAATSPLPPRAVTGGGGAHQPFNVQLVQDTQFTTVKVNGVVVFGLVSQPGSSGGSAGVATHFTNASFDNVSINDAQL